MMVGGDGGDTSSEIRSRYRPADRGRSPLLREDKSATPDAMFFSMLVRAFMLGCANLSALSAAFSALITVYRDLLLIDEIKRTVRKHTFQ